METILLMVVAFAAGAGSAAVYFRGLIGARQAERSALERAVIRAAIVCGGRITALDVRPPTDFALAEVETQLRRMHADGYCESDLTTEGHAVYVFHAYDEAPRRAHRLESLVLQMARWRGGLVDASKVAAESEFSYDEVRHTLAEMSDKGICRPTEHADTYRFFE